MTTYRYVHRLIMVGALFCAPGLAFPQTPTTTATTAEPPAKSTVKADMVPSLFVRAAAPSAT